MKQRQRLTQLLRQANPALSQRETARLVALLLQFKAADLFCGAGGTTAGFLSALKAWGIEPWMLAINHNPTAIDSHELNHEAVEHLCEELDRIRPKQVVPGGRLHFMAASPECTHHSNAAGGICRNEQSRATAWHVTRWISDLHVDCGMIENVPEFTGWGPLLPNGKPDPAHKGEYFEAFIQTLRNMGYVVDYRVLCCADYGDPTTRRRLFILYKKRKRADDVIVWPEPTHFDPERRARADEVLNPDFVMHLTHHGKRKIHGTHEPLPTVTAANRGELALIQPEAFVTHVTHSQARMAARSVKRPLPTITARAKGGELALVKPEAFVMGAGGTTGNGRPHSLRRPLKTVLSDSRLALAEPFLVPPRSFNQGSVDSTGQPLRTIVAASGRNFRLVQPSVKPPKHKCGGPRCKVCRQHRQSFLLGQQGGATLRPDAQPCPTVAQSGAIAQVEPMILRTDMTGANGSCVRSTKRPSFTVDKAGKLGLAQPSIDPEFVAKYYGTGTAKSVRAPLDTVTTKDRFCLVCPVTGQEAELDILFRMLQPHELAAAQGFAPGFQFRGTKEQQVEQIGNAVPCFTATALSGAIVAQTFGLPLPKCRRLQPWKSARDHVIDWSLRGHSIFGRKRPLSPNTIARIAAGIRKFVQPVELQQAFLVMLYGTNDARSVDRPAPTVSAKGGHIGLATVKPRKRSAQSPVPSA